MMTMVRGLPAGGANTMVRLATASPMEVNMAKRASMLVPEAGGEPSHESASDPGRTAIEIERTRLMKADAVLGSVAFSLTYAEWRCENGTDYANLVEVAREIVQETISGSIRSTWIPMPGEHVPS